ncbi:MAG: hypothetical protein FJ109_03910 [Deltaproteobacteria bacterium]|nr:hypothetical protein [Deltaproteobacteria bacterium]
MVGLPRMRPVGRCEALFAAYASLANAYSASGDVEILAMAMGLAQKAASYGCKWAVNEMPGGYSDPASDPWESMQAALAASKQPMPPKNPPDPPLNNVKHEWLGPPR